MWRQQGVQLCKQAAGGCKQLQTHQVYIAAHPPRHMFLVALAEPHHAPVHANASTAAGRQHTCQPFRPQ